MAPKLPPSSPLVFDSRTQVIENCEFLISKDDIVQVITSRDATQKLFRAYAVRCNEGTRELFLASAPCEDAQKAVESLHAKSSEAIHNHILANGFSGLRDPKTTLLEPILDDDDAASIISGNSDSSTAAFSEWGSSGDEAMMLKHAADAIGAPKDRQRPAGRHSSRAVAAPNTHEPVGSSRSRAAVRDFSDYANPAPPRVRDVRPARSRSPSFAFRPAQPPPHHVHPGQPSSDGPPGPPPPPPAMRGMGTSPGPHPYPPPGRPGIPAPPRPQNGMNQPMPSMPPMPPTQPFTYFRPPGHYAEGTPLPMSQGALRPGKPSGPNPPGGNNGNRNSNGSESNLSRPYPAIYSTIQLYAVRLTVHWLRHGQHRIIAQCHATRESLQSAALADVRMNPGAFTTDMKASPNSSNSRDGERLNLRAQVRQAVFGGESYDLRTFHGQDLTRLFRAMGSDVSMPSFEVVVEDVPRHAEDDDDDDDNEEDDDDESIRGPSNMAKAENYY
ncbi:hypothetical protein F5Y10DRAFT_262017 [Nemania abortiva]|nr:hypothetical protein F5Y10DRAFT_262017 [Nemania abortiva]